MRRNSILLLLFLIITLSAVEMPDFKYIVQRQHEAAQMKAESYSRWMDNMREDMRNMDCYDVRYYSIDIDVDFDSHYVEGIVISHLEILEDNVSLVSFNFTTDLDVVDIIMNSFSLSFTHADDLIEIELGTSYNPGDIIELEVQYSGYPQNRLNDGMKFQEHAGVPIVFTMVSPKGARKWWPCKDTPADKPDSLDISITYPSQYISASNGTLTEVINNGNGTNTAKWHESYPVCTYLTSFAVTNYQMYSFNWEYNDTNMMVDNFVYPEQYDMSVALYSLCEDMLTFYSDTYGEYPFSTEKYGHATCTNLGALAMEHQTVTSFDSGYISDPAAEYTIAHELSHHWAGDALSIGGWDHVWLKEGFASYSEALWAENLYGFEGLHAYMEAEDSGSPLDECLYRDPEGSGGHIFNTVIYRKGSWAIHMLRGLLGDNVFFSMLQNFFQDPDLIYGNITTQDLENAAEDVYGEQLDWFFDEWYYNYGRPLYKYAVYTSEVEDSIRVALHSEGSSGEPFSMYVPYKINDNYSGRFWVEDGFNYYVDMIFEDLESFEFDPDNWVLDYGYTEQIPVLEEIEFQREGSIVITWEEFFDPAIEGMNVYRKQAEENYILLNSEPIHGTAYYDDDVTPEEEYFYKIAVVFQTEGNYISCYSNEISTTPVNFTFDDGILLVDGTLDGLVSSPFPTDEEVDDYYSELLSGYSYTNWDIVEQGIPPLSEIANYSTIIWHADDISNYPFVDSEYNMKCYLLAGGNLLASCWKQLCMISENFQNYFLYLDDSTFHDQADFAGAFGINGFADIAVDTNKIPLPNWGDNLQYVNKFLPIEDAEAIFTYDSFSNDPTWENAVCGQRFSGDYKAYILGFPLYFMMQEQSEDIVQNILEDFEEESSIESYELGVIKCKLNNYPNPFNPSTTISFETTNLHENARIEIFNLKGQKVKTLSVTLSGDEGSGNNFINTSSPSTTLRMTQARSKQYSVTWNGTNQNNKPVSSGIYFYKLRSGDIEISRKMLLLK